MTNLRLSPETYVTPDVPAFRCILQLTGRSAAWVRLTGELDLANSSHLTHRLDQALGAARLIVLDLRQLTFMDSAGLAVIVAAHNRARRTRRRLVLVRGPAQVSRLLDVAGVSVRLEITNLKPVEADPVSADRASPREAPTLLGSSAHPMH
jgi:anti-anti-sigma factor